MYVGAWESDKRYNKGDIVFIYETSSYFTCSIQHTSNDLTYPSKEDIYWVHIDGKFLNDITLNGSIAKSRSFTTDNITNTSLLFPFEPNQYLAPCNTPNKDIRVISKEDLETKVKKKILKRKLHQAETSIENFKKQRFDSEVTDLREKLLLLNIDVRTKCFLMDKYDATCKSNGSDYSKGMSWLKTVSGLPFGKYKQLKVKASDPPEKIKEFFSNVKQKLDKHIHGLEHVKQEILQFVARKISNPHGKGHILALCGPPGVGKTKIIKSLSEALELPFFQINCGGLNDVSVITGHSETYIGSKPGKIVEILQSSNYMNPIIYLDEVDKISESKSVEINGILTHLLDEEQNNKFQDNYLSNVNINLSKVFFVLSFNDISKIDEIVCDRLKVVFIKEPTLEEKVQICKDKIIPELLLSVNFTDSCIVRIDNEVIEYIARFTKESGVRRLRHNLEQILNKLNYEILIGATDKLYVSKEGDKAVYNITRSYVDATLQSDSIHDKSYLSMYT